MVLVYHFSHLANRTITVVTPCYPEETSKVFCKNAEESIDSDVLLPWYSTGDPNYVETFTDFFLINWIIIHMTLHFLVNAQCLEISVNIIPILIQS